MSSSWFQKYKKQIELYTTENLRQEVEFDDTDEKFIPPSLLTSDGKPNLSLLFDYNLQPADKRYLLRKMEHSREEFRNCVLAEVLRKQEEERRKAEEAEDAKEIRIVKARFRKIQEKLDEKATETEQFQRNAKEREEREYFEEQRSRIKRREQETVAFEEREKERLDRLPDFPTSFSVCKRLHATPPKRRRADDDDDQQREVVIASSAAAVSPSDLVQVNFQDHNGVLEMVTDAGY